MTTEHAKRKAEAMQIVHDCLQDWQDGADINYGEVYSNRILLLSAQAETRLAASITGTCLKCNMGPMRESCAYPESCEHPGRELAYALNRALLDRAEVVAAAEKYLRWHPTINEALIDCYKKDRLVLEAALAAAKENKK